MTTLYLTEQHAVVRKEADYLVVQIPENKEKGTPKRKTEIPLIKIDQVVVVGDVTLTTPALHTLLDNGIEVCLLSAYGSFKGRLSPALTKNALIRLEQHQAHHDPQRRFPLARAFVAGKVANMRTLLMRANRKLQDEALAGKIDTLRDLAGQIAALTATPNARSTVSAPPLSLEPTVSEAQDDDTDDLLPANPDGDLVAANTDRMAGLGELLGLEGAATAAYFSGFAHLLRQEALAVSFHKRSRRPPTDPINALLSYGYVLLMHKVMTAIQIVGFDPYVGFLHSSQYGKPALALDLMEEFRPIIVDSVVLQLVNNRILQAKDFVAELGSFHLTDDGRKTFLIKFEERLNDEIEHPVFSYKVTYQRCLELQARLLAKTLTGEIPTYPAFIVR